MEKLKEFLEEKECYSMRLIKFVSNSIAKLRRALGVYFNIRVYKLLSVNALFELND